MCMCIYTRIVNVCIYITVYISMLNVTVRKKVHSVMTAVTLIMHLIKILEQLLYARCYAGMCGKKRFTRCLTV